MLLPYTQYMVCETPIYRISAFYIFTPIADPTAVRDALHALALRLDIRGTMLLAHEGINGTIDGLPEHVEELLSYIRNIEGMEGLTPKEAQAGERSFRRLKVKVKKEIVTMGIPGVDGRQTGTRVPPSEWNALIARDDVMLVDTRNRYEVRLGRFEGAIDPHTDTFVSFPEYAQKEILNQDQPRAVAMYCTGGIRCEKASAWLRAKGFEEVYQLDGGILRYLKEVPQEESRFEGACFVFDQRVSVEDNCVQGEHTLCFGCREPLSVEDKQDPRHHEGVACKYCADGLSDASRNSRIERAKQMDLAQARGEAHLAAPQISKAKKQNSDTKHAD